MLRNLIQFATLSNRPLNILTVPYDGYFETVFCKLLNCNMYGDTSTWNEQFEIPKNFFSVANIQQHVILDLIIAHGRSQITQIFEHLSHQYNIPLIFVEHHPAKKTDTHLFRKILRGNATVYARNGLLDIFKIDGPVIHIPCPIIPDYDKKEQILISGTFNKEDLGLIEYLKQYSSIPVRLIHGNKHLPYNAYVEQFMFSSHYLHLQQHVDYNLLHAIGAKCKILSIGSREIQEYHEFIPTCPTNDIKTILANICRAKVVQPHPDLFVSAWQQLLTTVLTNGYIKNENLNHS